jgi:hypothetical protein
MNRKKDQAGPNYLAIGLEVLAFIVVFNIAATFVFYYFIAPHMR